MNDAPHRVTVARRRQKAQGGRTVLNARVRNVTVPLAAFDEAERNRIARRMGGPGSIAAILARVLEAVAQDIPAGECMEDVKLILGRAVGRRELALAAAQRKRAPEAILAERERAAGKAVLERAKRVMAAAGDGDIAEVVREAAGDTELLAAGIAALVRRATSRALLAHRPTAGPDAGPWAGD